MLSALSMSITSCKDDDDDKKSEQRNADADPLDTDEAETAWRWLCALTDAQTLSSNWATTTYEPTVGIESENNDNTRIVIVGDLEEAKSKFADIAGVTADQLGGEVTVSQAGVGKMVWTPSKAGAQNLAEVTVDTKLIPHLQKIVYCTEEQRGQNGVFRTDVDGTAYYRLGDVVRDREGYYWICVRPAFKQGDKVNSHWINIINASETGNVNATDNRVPMPNENIYSKYDALAKYNSRTILLPTQLKYSREHMNNLSNLIWALLDPTAYANKVNRQGKGLCGFDYTYHGENFLKKVADYWNQTVIRNGEKQYTVWQILFNRTREQMKNMTEMSFIYKGYQWRTGRWGYVWEFTSKKGDGFQRKAPGSESDDRVRRDFADNGYDIRAYCGDPNSKSSNTQGNPAQFDQQKYTCVGRSMSGKEMDEEYSPFKSIPPFDDRNIYRYNEKTGKGIHSSLETETGTEKVGKPLSKPFVGCLLCDDYQFYSNVTEASKNDARPIAIVVHYGDKGSVETGTNYRGLAISTKLNEKGVKWGERLYSDCEVARCTSEKENPNILNGISCTKTLYEGCGKEHNHAAAKQYWKPSEHEGFSNWFIASVGQWILALKGMGIGWDYQRNIFTGDYKENTINLFFQNAGIEQNLYIYSNDKHAYWSSTLFESRYSNVPTPFRLTFNKTTGINIYTDDQDVNYNYVRSFIAF